MGSKDLGVEYHTKSEIAHYIVNHPTANAYINSYDAIPGITPPYSLGKVSDSTLNDSLALLNTFRYIAGLPANVTLKSEYNELAQAASVVNAANDKMTHYPEKPAGMDDALYQKGYEGASHSNIAYGWTSYKADNYFNIGYFMNKGWMGWTDPLKGEDTENEPLVNFCLPFSDKSGQRVGVIAVDVSISQLSKIVLAAKPSERGYCVLMAKNGSFIVHPDKEKLQSKTVFTQMYEGADHSVLEAAEAMLSGQSGMKRFCMNDESWSVFFKPFKRVEWEGRSDWQLDWSVGVVYPDADIHSVHNKLLYLVVAITIVGLLLFFLLCGWLVRHELKPLSLLTQLTQRIAAGNYDESVPATNREDEVGHLQNRLRKMQDRLKEQTADLENETMQLHEHSDELRAAYGRIEENDRMKTSFLHYITNQMAVPAESIDRSVTTLCNNYHAISKDEIDKQVDNIERKSDMLVELLNHMAHFTDAETGKEANHD